MSHYSFVHRMTTIPDNTKLLQSTISQQRELNILKNSLNTRQHTNTHHELLSDHFVTSSSYSVLMNTINEQSIFIDELREVNNNLSKEINQLKYTIVEKDNILNKAHEDLSKNSKSIACLSQSAVDVELANSTSRTYRIRCDKLTKELDYTKQIIQSLEYQLNEKSLKTDQLSTNMSNVSTNTEATQNDSIILSKEKGEKSELLIALTKTETVRQKLISKIKLLNLRMTEMDAECRSLKRELKSVYSEIFAKDENTENLTRQLNQFILDNRECSDKIKNLVEIISLLREENSNLTTSMSSLTQNLHSRENELINLNLAISSVQDKLTCINQKYQDVCAERIASQDTSKELENSNKLYQDQIESTNIELKEVRNSNEALANELNDLKAVDVYAEINRLKEKNLDLSNKIEQLTNLNDELTVSSTHADEKLKSLQQKHESLISTKDSVLSEITELKKELSLWKSKYNSEVDELQQRINTKDLKTKELINRLEYAENQNTILFEKVAELQQEKDDLGHRLSRSQELVDKKSQYVDELNAQVSSLNMTLDKLHND